MENEYKDKLYKDKIEALMSEYFEYRKEKELLDEDNKKSNIPASPKFPYFDDDSKKFRWFPSALDESTEWKNKDKPEYKPASPKQSGLPEPKTGIAPPLDLTESAQLQKDGISAGTLSDNVSKILEPFAALEVDKMDYKGSPIYNQLDRETVSQMASSAYNNAILNVSELGDLEAQSASYSKEMMIRALIRELIIKEIFFIRRARRW